MSDIPWALTFAAAIASGTPLVFAGLGTLLSERVGVVNLGVEGMMLVGAVTSVVVYGSTGSVELAFLSSGIAGLLAGILLCVVSITFRSNQIVAGLAITIFLTGVSVFVGSSLATDIKFPVQEDVPIPLLSDIPFVGQVFFNHNVYVYASWLLAIGLSLFLFHTRPGLVARSLGENPQAAAALGVRVSVARYLYVSVGGLLIGFGGGYVAVAILGYWTGAATIGGLGWIAIALVIFASWRPIRLVVGAYLFGLILQANFASQAAGYSFIPASFLSMLPYLITIALLTVLSLSRRRSIGVVPAALGLPFHPGER
jgi:ABC-type uncharacterized transport system permease subunit